MTCALVIRLGALGDVLHTTPAVQALAAAGFAVDYLTAPGAAPLVEGQPGIRRVIRYDPRQADRGLGGAWRLLRRLQAGRYDVVVDLQGNVRTGLLVLALRAPRRVRYRKDRPGTPRHAVENFAATLAPLGLAAAAGRPPAPRFRPGEADRLAAEAALAGAGWSGRGPLVALQVGASQPLKCWAPERLGRLAARLLARPDLGVVLTSAPEDRPHVDLARAAAREAGALEDGRLLDLGGCLGLGALGALYARCAAVVVADTGPLHVAAAVGTRAVGLFGPTDPGRTGPYGEGHRVVRADLDCVPCRAKRCLRTDRPRACMEDLTPETVAAAVLAAVDEAPRGEPGRTGGAPVGAEATR